MRKLLLFIGLIGSCCCSAQNYECFQPGVKNYFINDNGYLRGIRIDSVVTPGDSVVYYPFRTPRGPYETIVPYVPLALNDDGGSWLGKRVVRKNDGTFVFDSYWDDSVIIKTQAHTGDNWVFYDDTSNLYYGASVIAEDTMTFLSTFDSVKTILINTYNTSGIVTSDPLNGFKIILSKSHGFVQVFDLYTFPYHRPDTVFRIGLDFYLDRSLCTHEDVTRNPSALSIPGINTQTFKLLAFINPTDNQNINWNNGDVLHHVKEMLDLPLSMPIKYNYTYTVDTVVNKIISTDSTEYFIAGLRSSTSEFVPDNTTSYSKKITCYNSGYSIAGPSFMPEDRYNAGGNYIFYYPNNISYCTNSPVYRQLRKHYQSSGIGMVIDWSMYKLGIGLIGDDYTTGDPSVVRSWLWLYNGRNAACVPVGLSDPNLAKNDDQFILFPNPANKEIIIEATVAITDVTVTNTMGQIVYNHKHNTKKVQVNVASLASGVYLGLAK